MEFTLFRLRVVADWLELEVSTLNPHPAHRIQKASMGAFSYVTGLDPETRQNIRDTGKQGKNTPTTAFACRIQSPERFSVVVSALNTISDLDPNATITVRGIEIALDAYRRTTNTTDEQLAEMVALMLRGINRPEGAAHDEPRFYSWRGTPELRQGKRQVERGVLDGKTAMYGNHDDDFIVRGYLKNYDTVRNSNDQPKGKTLLTNPLDHRARIEVRLQGPACPIQTLDVLKIFKFETLAKFFKFRMPTSGQSGIEAVISDRLGSLGGVISQTGQLKATHGSKRKTKNTWLSEAAHLNEIARKRLQKLTTRWGNATGRGKVAGPKNCANSPRSTGSQRPEISAPSFPPLHPGNPCHHRCVF